MEEVLNETKERMEKTLKNLKTEFSRIRTGKASPAILETIKVDYYGMPTPLIQIAGISVPEPRLLVIQPWDKNAIGEIEKAILKSGLGLTPKIEGNVLKIPIPPLSMERRKELIKLVRKLAEDSKVAIRNIRRDANEKLKAKKDNKEISEDDLIRYQKKVQEITDDYIKKIEEVLKKKEEEIEEE
ncbi:MAG: ribosome recycling factor [candidate division WOR-3 bacterium]|uniref:Ribosome-recycling factor n=1 Tax=candidate division WOR-3 bacterium TaxID=2052148 RepID=A0A7V4ABS3_UNCW3